MSRLTMNPKYGDAGPGDKALFIMQGSTLYMFVTQSVAPSVNNNVRFDLQFPTGNDIEGLWTFIYYSYSVDAAKAVGFVKYGAEGKIQTITQPAGHQATKYLRFLLGGNDEKREWGINAQFFGVMINTQPGAYTELLVDIEAYLTANPAPAATNPTNHKRFWNEPVTKGQDDAQANTLIDGEANRFPLEYAFSSWYRWQPAERRNWNSYFRVSVRKEFQGNQLGDNTLACYGDFNQIRFASYSYDNLNAGGNNEIQQNIQHKDKISSWFFVYFGYNRVTRQGYAHVKWSDSEDVFEFKSLNHYLNPLFYISIGRDLYWGWSGKVAYPSWNTGAGVFRNNKDYKHEKNIFGYQLGLDNLFGTIKFATKEPSGLLDSSSQQQKALIDKEFTQATNFEQYGYGYWFRYLTLYPIRQEGGKVRHWYHMSRLTLNQKWNNANMGDFTLTVQQAPTYYRFFTQTIAPTANVNVYQDMSTPNSGSDIEGIWNFVYYSYSAESSKAVGFYQFGTEKIRQFSQSVTHQATKYLRFILGGKDDEWAINGQFFGVTISTEPGAFTEQLSDIEAYKAATPFPVDTPLADNKRIWNEPVSRIYTEPGVVIEKYGSDDKKFPQEYALSGWYRWAPTSFNNWSTMFRVTNKLPPGHTQTVGDQVLATYLNPNYVRYATYSYANMNMGGQSDLFQDKAHNNRHLQWFFIYFAYNRQQRVAFGHVKFSTGEETMEWKTVNHYLTPTFNLYVGRDGFYDGWNGKVAYPSWNTGAGVFRTNKDYAHPQDIFGYQIGVDTLNIKIPFKPADPGPLYENAHDQDKPVIDQELPSETPYGDYGYGFWLRWITYYPKILLQGKSAANYFVSRLTSNPKYADNNNVDRHLLILLSGNVYNFYATQKSQSFNIPEDIEGLWTYVYLSYSADEYQVPVFIKIGDQKLQTAIIPQLTLPSTKYLRFIVGGNDQKRYPGLNGYFSKVRFTTKGAYTTSLADIQALIDADQPSWTLINKLAAVPLNTQVVQKRGINDAPIVKTVLGTDEASRYPLEYAISGWFRWDTSPQSAWHTFYRVTIKNSPQTNADYPGDRTLCTWLGGGSYWFATYNVANMQAAGNANQYSTIAHGDKHTKWFYMYHGHDRVNKKQTVYVKWYNSDGAINWDNVRHFMTPQFYVYLGKDDHYPGINGGVGVVNFVYGPGAFRSNKLYDQEEDLFAYKVGLASQTFFVQTETKTTQEEEKE